MALLAACAAVYPLCEGSGPAPAEALNSKGKRADQPGLAIQNRRQFARLKHRVACELHHSGIKTTGIVLDVSPRGLFVRMSAGAAPKIPGTEVRVVVRAVGREPFELMARLARAKLVRRELVNAANGGFGLEVTSAPEDFYELVQALS